MRGDDAPGFDSDEPVDEAPDAVDDDPDPDVAPVSADATQLTANRVRTWSSVASTPSELATRIRRRPSA